MAADPDAGAPDPVRVRVARPDERATVAGVLDAALLDVPDLGDRLAAGEVLVAVPADGEGAIGALVAAPRGDAGAGAHLEAVAVRRRRRGQGVGTALVAAAADRWGRLTADCAERVRPFYESLGFELEERDGRLWGVLHEV